MLFTLILPEFLVANAYAERIVAEKSMDEVKLIVDLTVDEMPNWTRAHSFYAEIGDFVIHKSGGEAACTVLQS
jgi:hypothetical protein